MAAGKPGGKRHLAEPREIAGPVSESSRTRASHEKERRAMESIGLTVVQQGMRVVGDQ